MATIFIQQLEAVQSRAARFVTGDKTTSSTSQMIANLGWSSLQQRRTEARLVMMFGITHDFVDIPVAQYLQHPAKVMHIRGPSQRYMLQFCRTDMYYHSFFPAGIQLWNQLPSMSPPPRPWNPSRQA